MPQIKLTIHIFDGKQNILSNAVLIWIYRLRHWPAITQHRHNVSCLPLFLAHFRADGNVYISERLFLSYPAKIVIIVGFLLHLFICIRHVIRAVSNELNSYRQVCDTDLHCKPSLR